MFINFNHCGIHGWSSLRHQGGREAAEPCRHQKPRCFEKGAGSLHRGKPLKIGVKTTEIRHRLKWSGDLNQQHQHISTHSLAYKQVIAHQYYLPIKYGVISCGSTQRVVSENRVQPPIRNILREYKRIIYAYFLFKEFTKLKCWVILGWFDQSRLWPDHCRDVVVGEIHLFILKSIQVPFSLPICVQADYIPIQKQPTCSMYKICIRNCTQNYPDMIYHTWIYMDIRGAYGAEALRESWPEATPKLHTDCGAEHGH